MFIYLRVSVDKRLPIKKGVKIEFFGHMPNIDLPIMIHHFYPIVGSTRCISGVLGTQIWQITPTYRVMQQRLTKMIYVQGGIEMLRL